MASDNADREALPVPAGDQRAVDADERMIITPAEAESLLAEGPYVHNFLGGGMIMLG